MVWVEAQNGDTWELDEAWLPMLFERAPLPLPVKNKESFDELVLYARDRRSMMNRSVAGAVEEEAGFDKEFIKRYNNRSSQLIAHVAFGARMLSMKRLHRVIFEDQLRRLMEAGASEDQARADLDLMM